MVETDDAVPTPVAWQPITPTGIAAFANAPLRRLLTVQAVIGLFLMAAFITYFARTWVPVISEVTQLLPETSIIRDGQLHWPPDTPPILVENSFFSLAVARQQARPAGQTADFKIELSRDELKMTSLLGYWSFTYPRWAEIPLTRAELEPKWGAWLPALLAGISGLITFGIWLSWCGLAAVYSWPLRVMVYFRDRQTSRLGCWKLSSAALLPGALLMGMATLLYALEQIPLVGVIVAFGIHLVMGPVYAFLSAFALPLLPEAATLKGNPFSDSDKKKSSTQGRKNPFRRR